MIRSTALRWTLAEAVPPREMRLIGPDRPITALEALKAITINAAYQCGERQRKGSLEPGKLADLAILDRNPLTVAPAAIKDLRVLDPIEEGKTIYTAKPPRAM